MKADYTFTDAQKALEFLENILHEDLLGDICLNNGLGESLELDCNMYSEYKDLLGKIVSNQEDS